jgi:hypothetical protein
MEDIESQIQQLQTELAKGSADREKKEAVLAAHQ